MFDDDSNALGEMRSDILGLLGELTLRHDLVDAPYDGSADVKSVGKDGDGVTLVHRASGMVEGDELG